MSKEDSVPTAYKYSWNKDSELPLQEFLTKARVGVLRWIEVLMSHIEQLEQFKPSMVQNDGTKPWIWVRGSEPKLKSNVNQEAQAIAEASHLLKEVTEKVESIKNDESIPVRSNKKTGAKSKKEVREQVQAEATEKLREISVKHGYVGGKWLIFAPAERVDAIWSGIATSLVSGPLHSTAAYLAKVSTSSESETSNSQHLICVYFPDVYDKDAATEIMKILLRKHGVNLTGVKSDLYTVSGIDSKHPSGIPSTVWKNSAILPEKEIKELKDAFFADLASGTDKPVAAEDTTPVAATTDKSPEVQTVTDKGKSKAKPKLKKKVESDDPFASDDDEDDKRTKEPTKPPVESKKIPVLKAKAKAADFDDDDDDAEDEEKRNQELAARKKIAKEKRAMPKSDDDDEEEKPKKKKRAVK